MRYFIAIAVLASTASSFAPPSPIPDTGSSAFLMGLGLAGIGLVGRFFMQKRR